MVEAIIKAKYYCYGANDTYCNPKARDDCFVGICGPSSISLNADIGAIGV